MVSDVLAAGHATNEPPPPPDVSSARQAEPLLRKVLALREKVLGEDHADAAESLVNLAVLNNKKVRGVCVYHTYRCQEHGCAILFVLCVRVFLSFQRLGCV